MYKISDVINFVEELFPLNVALGFDNPGLLVGNRDDELTGVLLTLDCTSQSIKEAINKGCNLIISHHPLIFGGINSVSNDTSTGRIITSLIKNGISLYACHTQLDMTDEFGNFEIANAIGAKNPSKLEGASLGVVFDLEKKDTLKSYSKKVTVGLGASGFVTLNSPDDMVSRVFVQGGAFDEDNIPFIIDGKVDLVISGEIKHHHCVLLDEYGISTLIVGHNASERIYLPKLKNVLDEHFENVDIFVNFGKERSFI